MQTPARTEQAFHSLNGYSMIAAALVLILAGALSLVLQVLPLIPGILLGVLLVLSGVITLAGLYMLQPNTARILTLFGQYRGTDRAEGLRWANPLFAGRSVSLRARNFNAPTLKVNDKRGNPVEIGAAVVWRVRDTAQALFEVDDFELYVKVQAETALRHLASQHAYDHTNDPTDSAASQAAAVETTLRGSIDEVAHALRTELQARFAAAGVEALDAKLTHLAYAPEIAQVMLRRQQAEAIVGARTQIVLGAVSMVEAALRGLSERDIVVLDDERKAAMVSNLLVVLCADKDTQPIINTGTLYN